MKKYTVHLLALSAIVLALSGCMDMKNALDMPVDKYEKTESSTDADGTVTQKQSSSEIAVDKSGNEKTVIKSKTTNDPEGLFNKTTTSQIRQEMPHN
jgi:hypothetical protein